MNSRVKDKPRSMERMASTLAQLAAMQSVTRPYHAPPFRCWSVTGVLAAHLTLLLQQGQRLAGVEQSQVAQALCHHIPALLFCFTAAVQQLQDLHGNKGQDAASFL